MVFRPPKIYVNSSDKNQSYYDYHYYFGPHFLYLHVVSLYLEITFRIVKKKSFKATLG